MLQPSAGAQTLQLSVRDEAEKELIIGNFKDNEPLLKSIRALFFGLGVSEEEKAVIRGLGADIKAVIRRRFILEFDRNGDLAVMADIWLNLDERIIGQHPDTIAQAIGAFDQCMNLMKQALALLDNPDLPAPDISYDPVFRASDKMQTYLLGRNMFIKEVTRHLFMLNAIAKLKTETPEQAAERARKDSVK